MNRRLVIAALAGALLAGGATATHASTPTQSHKLCLHTVVGTGDPVPQQLCLFWDEPAAR